MKKIFESILEVLIIASILFIGFAFLRDFIGDYDPYNPPQNWQPTSWTLGILGSLFFASIYVVKERYENWKIEQKKITKLLSNFS